MLYRSMLKGGFISRLLSYFTQYQRHYKCWLAQLRGDSSSQLFDTDNYTPLHAELFSTDQMVQHAKALAGVHRLGECSLPDQLLKRLDDNAHILDDTRRLLMVAVTSKLRIEPAGEWLLDNFYLIEEQIRTAKQHLPKGYSRGLPRLAHSVSQGLPRVYDLVLEAIAHSDWHLDAQMLSRFVAAYQTVKPLSLGELWAVPIMLRLVLIEHLRRAAERLASASMQRSQAQDWAMRMIEMAETDPNSLILVIADMARSQPPMTAPFIAELARLLQGHGLALSVPLTWIEHRLAESSLTIEQMVLLENRQQATEQVSISNAINSLRFLGFTNWQIFVENISVVEDVLLHDPAEIYADMDFATRDQYRHAVEYLAKHSELPEWVVAQQAVDLAQANTGSKHVGFYLIGDGLAQLESAIAVRLPLLTRLRRGLGHYPLGMYLAVMTTLTLGVTAILLAQWPAMTLQQGSLMVGLIVALLALLAGSQLASVLTNWWATLVTQPKLLPRMDFTKGLPQSLRSLVVIPTLIARLDQIDALLEALEVRYLGNRDAYIHFALLTDFQDATQETLPQDAELLEHLILGVQALNQKYPSRDPATGSATEGDKFYLLHRSRSWNAAEKIWMGYERKRGKLADLNALLREANMGRFAKIVGDIQPLLNCKYVITLDTDTQLPKDSARQLISVMAHPLNHPQYDPLRKLIVGGYAILQPSMAASLAGAKRSHYAQWCGNEPGIDPYTRLASDVYQDIFEQGSFIGKGIYDVAAFEQVLKDRLPENRILSHDLLEGSYARSGLVSDVQLYEEYPPLYAADVDRQTRWIRGDWQIAQWLLPRVPNAQGQWLANPLTALARWKIGDNLRRSLVPCAMFLLLLAGWWKSESSWLWTLSVLAIMLLPPVLIAMVDIARWPKDVFLHQHLGMVLRLATRSLVLTGFRIACLPYEAWFSGGAILRTLWRVHISRRHLLEWQVAETQPAADRGTLRSIYRRMWFAPVAAVTCFSLLLWLNPAALAAANIILILWLLAPVLAWWASQPLPQQQVEFSTEQTVFLRKIARKTWHFFATFVGAEDNWLPPDNMQEDIGITIAHRTSPTNIGLALLANLSAWDFGFIPQSVLLQRTQDSLATLSKLEKYQGHIYNWYDTKTLQVLYPRYISTVDSGNLAGHLLTLREGLLAVPNQPLIAPRVLLGLLDTLAVAQDAAQLTDDSPLSLALIQLLNRSVPDTVGELFKLLQAAIELITAAEEANAEWVKTLLAECKALQADMIFLMPWLTQTFLENAPWIELSAVISLVELLKQLDLWLEELSADKSHLLMLARERVQLRMQQCQQLAQQASELADMQYGFLYDPSCHLLAVGFNVDEMRLDSSFYDLLASEARLVSFVAIAQGQIPLENWFALGRLLTVADGEPILVSWSGSMFEYLMPVLVMPNYADSLLAQSCRAAVARHIQYGQQSGLPWGVSESGYNAVDVSLNYRYQAFGVPGLGLKRGLAEDWVIAPYASVLALMVAPESACENLQLLAELGLEGQYGFYEAIDYTPSRQTTSPIPGVVSASVKNPGSKNSARKNTSIKSGVMVRSFMAHHQGMSLLAIAQVLLNQPMQQRFEQAPELQSVLLLLQERIPKTSVFHTHVAQHAEGKTLFDLPDQSVHQPIGFATRKPQIQLLSNGRYHLMLSNAGSGYSRWKELAITRWREDACADTWGSFIYLRDRESGQFWSTTYQPTCAQPESYSAIFAEGRAEYRRVDHEIESYSEIVLSPEDDIELRRVHLTNRSSQPRHIELTSYADVVLTTQATDMTQPSFASLFVQTEIVPSRHAILCTRRPRSQDEPVPWMLHLLAAQSTQVTDISYETDRVRFVGRGNSLARPQAMLHPRPLADAPGNEFSSHHLSNSAGSVLDPIIAIRCHLLLAPGQTAAVDWITGAASSRESCVALIEKYQEQHAANRVFDLASTHSCVLLRQINALEGDALLYRRLASSVLYNNAALRAEASVLLQNQRGQSGLWSYAISGDLPIVLLKIADTDNIHLAQQLIQCHAYWRLKGLMVDLVIWNEDHAGYRQQLQEQILALVAQGIEANAMDRPGGIFVRTADQMSSEDRILLQSVARVIISDSHGSLHEQITRRRLQEKRVAPLAVNVKKIQQPSTHLSPVQLPSIQLPSIQQSQIQPASEHSPLGQSTSQPMTADPSASALLLSNAYGGFSADGKEYVINTTRQLTPLPWVNVLANPQFGSVISESGLAYTWSENAHEFRLTPWSSDQVGASSGEAIYLRDEDSGQLWSPMPRPIPSASPYQTRHGFGYSVFEHVENGIESQLWVYVDLQDTVKFSKLTVRNLSGVRRRLSATGYVEWVLAELRAKSALHIVTEIDADSGALFARNAYNTAFAGRVAFFDVDDQSRTVTGDRDEFIGRNGSLEKPQGLLQTHLSGRVGAALDPCAALQVPFELAEGQSREMIFRLGAGQTLQQARELARRLRKPGSARAALQKVQDYWQRTLGVIRIDTPDVSLNLLTNGWLLYQALACRLWARSGFYQSGGAFGFRDQLQDSMALVHAEPKLVREHLLVCAQRQYPQGDVQHWWHPPAGNGVRTRCSDDYLWLPLATCRYVLSTGDAAVLDEIRPFLSGRLLNPDEESYYEQPEIAQQQASLYQHCVCAIQRALQFGKHGLPLMGSGDWNDGMNLVGIHGQGESVWLGFFLYEILQSFVKLAELKNDAAFAELCMQQAQQLRIHIEQHGWDGSWYRRAYFDNGDLLGSVANTECVIDSLSQSWSVLSGAGDVERARLAMEALDQRLVRRADGLVQLLDPPFDKSDLNPGYIKGYVPGVRENGGQYTHAAVWAAMAFAKQGDHKRAWEVLNLINPIRHGVEEADIYKVEPYVLAADVYAIAPHTGRGGWTWYTGSASWLYRLITESLLGFNRQGNRLTLQPCIPPDWPSFAMHYNFGATLYHICVLQEKNTGNLLIMLDGVPQSDQWITLVDDGQVHEVVWRV